MTLKKMLSALAGFVGARFLGAGLGLLTQLVLARSLLPEHVTQVFVAMSAAAFMALLMNGGETQLASTHLPRLMALGGRRALQAFHGMALRHMVGVYAVLALCLAAAWASRILPQPTAIALAVGLAAAPCSALMRYNAIIANGLRWFPLSYVPDFVVRPALFLLTILILIGVGAGGNVYAVLAAFLAYVWTVTLGAAFLMGSEGLRPSHWFSYRKRHAQMLRPRSIALLLVSIVSFAFADVVMLLAGFLFLPEDAAIVGVAVRLAAIAGFVLQAAQLFVLPDFSEAMAKRDTPRANGVLWQMNSVTLLMALAALLGVLLLGRFALSFFGPHYVQGQVLLTLLLVGQSIRAFSGMNQNLISIGGYQVRTAWPCAVALASLLVAAVVLVPAMGLPGMGYAVIVAEVVWMLILANQAQVLCGRRADLLWLARNA